MRNYKTAVHRLIGLHIGLSVLAWLALALASLMALTMAVQHWVLKRGGSVAGPVSRLPPLEVVELWLFRLLALAFVSLGLGFAAIANLYYQWFEAHLLAKTVISLIAWVVLACLLLGRHYQGWRGGTAIGWTLLGFLLLGIAYMGNQIVVNALYNAQ